MDHKVVSWDNVCMYGQNKFRLAALLFTAFITIGALWGAIMFWLSPSGTLWSMEPMLAVMQRELSLSEFLFRDLILSGVALLLIIGVPHGLTFVAFYRKKAMSPYCYSSPV